MSGSKLGTGLMVGAGVLIAATVAAAIVVMGSPGVQRERRLDERRIADLAQIEQAVEAHHREHDALPANLVVLAARPGVGLSMTDPVDGSTYVYRIEGKALYVLCARFGTDSAEEAGAGRRGGVYASSAAWAHGRGETCFRRHVEPRQER